MSEAAPQQSEQETSSRSTSKESVSLETATATGQESEQTNLRSEKVIEPAGLDFWIFTMWTQWLVVRTYISNNH